MNHKIDQSHHGSFGQICDDVKPSFIAILAIKEGFYVSNLREVM